MDRLNTNLRRFFRRQLLGGLDSGLPSLPDILLPGRSSTTSATQTTAPASQSSVSSVSSQSTAPPSEQTPPANPSLSSTRTSEVPSTSSAPSLTVSPAETSTVLETAIPTTTDVNTATTTEPPANPQSTEIVVASMTVTRSNDPATSSEASEVGAARNSFLDNKVLSGVVFGICGLVGLLLIAIIVWFALRKSRRIKALEKEIISFDPEDVGRFHSDRGGGASGDNASINSMEKGRRSQSSLDNYAGGGYANTMKVDNGEYRSAVAPFSEFRPPNLTRPGNAAFNPMSNSNMNYPRTYALPSQTFKR